MTGCLRCGHVTLLLLSLTLSCLHQSFYVAANKMKLECEKRCHTSLSPQQRANLCNQEEYSLGPAACSVMAKEALHLRYEDIYKLCHEATSAAPVECMLKLDAKDRGDLGFSICAKATSTLPSECFQRILSIGKAAPKKAVAEFCQSNTDHAPDLCVKAAHEHLGMKAEEAMLHCQDAFGSGDASTTNPRNTVTAECIATLKDYNRNAYSLQAKDIVQFCSKINPNQYVDMITEDTFPIFATSATDCFLQLVQDRAESVVKLSYPDMLHLCQNAPVAQGPTNCTNHVISVTAHREPHVKLTAESIVTLCTGAVNQAPADCFAESKGLGNLEERAQLCNAAPSTGPALCYRRSTAVFKNHPDEHNALCLMAESEGPAECAAAAPHYLIAEEKVHLCTNAPVTGYMNPIKCLQAVHTYSKNFQNAPKRALGYFQENLQLDNEWTSRALLVSMCSFSDSQDPLAAAECYKSVPTSLQHDDAVRLCTNISSSQAIQHIQLCQRILPKTWSSEAISYLCEGLETRSQTEAIVKCAVELSKMTPQHRLLDALGIAKLCRTESVSLGVMKCVQRLGQLPSHAASLLLPSPTSGSSSSGASSSDSTTTTNSNTKSSTNTKTAGKSATNTPAVTTATSTSSPSTTNYNQRTVMTLCEHATSTASAECVHEMAKLLTSQVSFAPNMTERLCTRPDYASILVCLSHVRNKRLLDGNDVLRCAEEKRTLTSLKVKRIYSWENDNLQIMAGKRFALWFDVFDQWQQKFEDDVSGNAYPAKTMLKISINENNAQGAILWGYRTNYTSAGMLYFHSLIISQPGAMEIRISVIPPASASSTINPSKIAQNSKKHAEKTIAVFQLTVLEDPVAKETAPCMYVLRDGFCPHDVSGLDHDAYFPMTRSYTPSLPHYAVRKWVYNGGAGNYLHNMYCAGDKLAHWGIRSHLHADGSLHVEYRSGMDSIWTGIGLPRYEMTPEQKLGLSLPPELVREYQAWEATAAAESPAATTAAPLPSSLNKALTRLIKRAYYRASLQWHPDRWSGLEQYKPIVQGIFQQITEAYDLCQARWLRTTSSGVSGGNSNSKANDHEPSSAPVETPVYE